VTRAGSGGGTITSVPSGIGCPVTCVASYTPGARVTLTPQADVGSSFGGWSGGGCSGAGACVVTLDTNTAVTATFVQQFFNLTVTTSGPGSVTSSPSGISCGTTCVAGYQPGTSVTLTATAGAGAVFVGWSGACAGGSAFCNVSMTAFRTVTATFTRTVGGSFTDDPPIVSSTLIKAIHVMELRLAIDSARARRALASFAWTDPVIAPGVTPVRAIHVTQMRTALIQAYQAAGLTPPTFSDATLTTGSSPVRATHIAELRTVVLALP